MTISELIRRLEELKAEHGDLPVWCWDDRGPFQFDDAEFKPACTTYGDDEELPDRVELR